MFTNCVNNKNSIVFDNQTVTSNQLINNNKFKYDPISN